MTATIHTPMPVEPRVRNRSWSTPGWLRLFSVSLAAATVVAGIIGTAAVVARHQAAGRAAAQAEPLLVFAQTADVDMSEANATIAGAFLSGPLGPQAGQAPFETDLARSSAAVTAAAQLGGTDARVRTILTTLTSGLSTYQAAIATAEADNRQGYPVASAYLAEANYFMRSKLLRASQSLYATEQAGLIREDSQATNATWLVVLMVLMFAGLVAVIWIQLDMSRRFRRSVNAGLALATVLLLGGAVWTVSGTTAGDRAISQAEQHGTVPLAVLTRARILAQQARADDELTLVTRDSNTTYQDDFKSTAATLTGLLASSPVGWTAAEKRDLASASNAWSQYLQDHSQIRDQDGTGSFDRAVASDSAAAQASSQIDSALGTGVDSAVGSFLAGATAASRDSGGLEWGLPLALGLAALAAMVGVEPRIREYR